MTHSREFSSRISQLQQIQKSFFAGSQNVFPSQPKKGFRSWNKFRRISPPNSRSFFAASHRKDFAAVTTSTSFRCQIQDSFFRIADAMKLFA